MRSARGLHPDARRSEGPGDGPKFWLHQTELIPFVEENTAATRPVAFSAGILSAALHALRDVHGSFVVLGISRGQSRHSVANDFLVKQKRNFATKHKNLPVNSRGSRWREELVTPRVGFVRTFSARNYKLLALGRSRHRGEGHAGVKPEFYNRGLRFLFH